MGSGWRGEFVARVRAWLPPGARALVVGASDAGSLAADCESSLRATLGVSVCDAMGLDEAAAASVGDPQDPGAEGLGVYDLVVCTDALRRCERWADLVHGLVVRTRPGGLVVLTARGPGVAPESGSGDFWRCTRWDLRRMLGGVCELIDVGADSESGWVRECGLIARRVSGPPAMTPWRKTLDAVQLHRVRPSLYPGGQDRPDMGEPVSEARPQSIGADEPIWDQFSRYSAVASALRANLDGGSRDASRPLRVLDVGSGAPRLLRGLLPEVEVWCLDPLLEGAPADDPFVLRGRLEDAGLEAGSFDWVVCVDTLEHVPPEARAGFLERLVALPSEGLVIAGPLSDGGGAQAADEAIDAVYMARYGRAYPWLAEHREYGLPSASLVTDALEAGGLAYASFGNGHLPWHVLLLPVTLMLMEHPVGRGALDRLSRLFRDRMLVMDHAEPAYRRVIVARRSGAARLPELAAIDAERLSDGDAWAREGVNAAVDDLGGALQESARQRLSAEAALGVVCWSESQWRTSQLRAVAEAREQLERIDRLWSERSRHLASQRDEAVRALASERAAWAQAQAETAQNQQRAMERLESTWSARARLLTEQRDKAAEVRASLIEALREAQGQAQMLEREHEALLKRADDADRTARAAHRQLTEAKARYERTETTLTAQVQAYEAIVEDMQQSLAVRLSRGLGRVKRACVGMVRAPRATTGAILECVGKAGKRALPIPQGAKWPVERAYFTLFSPFLRSTPGYAAHKAERLRRRGLLPAPPADAVVEPKAMLNGSHAARPVCDGPALAIDTDPPAVIVFGIIDWHFRHQRPQHLAAALARKGHRVFYVSPRLVARPRADMDMEVLDVGEGASVHHVRLWVNGAPRIYHGMPSAEQQAQMIAGLRRMMLEYRIGRAICKLDHPAWVWLARCVPNASIVYDCMDYHAGFEETEHEVQRLEEELLSVADLTLVSSRYLEEYIAPKTRAHAMIRNACDPDHFAHPPADLWRDPKGRRVIGYLGAIAEWFDAELIAHAAKVMPDCVFLLVGADSAQNEAKLAGRKNVRFVGEIPYAEAASYVHAMDVCLIPFQLTKLIQATNPVKVYEYLAAGKPVVTTDLPELREAEIDALIHRCESRQAFVDAIRRALDERDDAALAERRRAFARGQTWAHRAGAVDSALASMRDPLVSVVVVTWNNLALTRACLESVLAEPSYRNIELIVVDNASSDETPAYLRSLAETEPRVRVLAQSENLGFAGGNNVGLRAAQGEFICLLNNDTVVTDGWLRTLVNHARRDASIGLIGPVTNNIGNEARVETGYDTMPGMRSEAFVITRAQAGGTRELEAAAFFCVLGRAEVWREVGEIDESYQRGYFEDDDYCVRVRKTGRRIVLAEDVFVHHHLAASFGSLGQDERNRLLETNRRVYEAKWGPWRPHRYRAPDEHPPRTIEAARQRL